MAIDGFYLIINHHFCKLMISDTTVMGLMQGIVWGSLGYILQGRIQDFLKGGHNQG